MTGRVGLAVLAAAGLAGPAVLWVVAICALRFVRSFGIAATIYVAVFLGLGIAVG